jgi:hypothetical protein
MITVLALIVLVVLSQTAHGWSYHASCASKLRLTGPTTLLFVQVSYPKLMIQVLVNYLQMPWVLLSRAQKRL